MIKDEITTEIQSKVSNTDQRNYLYKYLKEINAFENLSRQEEVSLAIAKDAGDDQAREKLINHNLRWVVSIARNFWTKGNYQQDLWELIAQGNLGLIAAVDRFNYKKDSRVSTYATSWIIREIRKYLASFKTKITHPEHVTNKMKAVSNISKNLEMILSRPARPEEISEAASQRLTTSEVEQIIKLMQNSVSTVSLDSKVRGPKESSSEMTVADSIYSTEPSPQEKYEQKEKRKALSEALSSLKPIQRILLEERYGWNNGGETKTFEELATILYEQGYTNKKGGKISKQYLQVLETKAFEMLRRYPGLSDLLNHK